MGPCRAAQGRVGWDFSREGARPGLGPGSSRHPHPSLLQGTAKAKPSSGRDYVYWVDPWRGAVRSGWQRETEAERAWRGVGIREGAGSDHHPLSSSLSWSNSQAEPEHLGGTWALLWRPWPPPFSQGGVADLSGRPSQGKEWPSATPSPTLNREARPLWLSHSDPSLKL